MITKIKSFKPASVYFEFDNGNTLSIIFGDMTYSDNYDLWKIKGAEYSRQEGVVFESTTVEIMPGGHPAFIRWMEKKYVGSSVCGYVPVSEIPAILRRADSKVYQASHLQEKENI